MKQGLYPLGLPMFQATETLKNKGRCVELLLAIHRNSCLLLLSAAAAVGKSRPGRTVLCAMPQILVFFNTALRL